MCDSSLPRNRRRACRGDFNWTDIRGEYCMDRVEQGWIGIDAGKGHHHAVLIDRDGQRLLSRRVINDQPDLVALIDTVRDRVVDPVWMIDLAGGSASLLIALLLQHGQRVVYLPGRAVNSGLSRLPGEEKTDAKDAAIIADQARMRRDLRELHMLDEDIAQLQLLSSYRADLAADRTRSINRLRSLLTGIFPALERVLDFTHRGPLILTSGFQTPTAIRQLGAARLAWLKRRGVRGAGRLARAAVEAASRQRLTSPARQPPPPSSCDSPRLCSTSTASSATLIVRWPAFFGPTMTPRSSPSLTGIGDVLGAECLAVVGGSLAGFCLCRPPRRLRRPRTPAARLRLPRRQSAPAPALQPATAARLLHLSHDQHPIQPSLEDLLRRQTSPRQATHLSCPGPRPTTRQRALGHAPRPPSLPRTTAETCARRLTNRIENQVPSTRHWNLSQVRSMM